MSLTAPTDMVPHRILFLTSRPPYPISGDRVRVRQQISWLGAKHDVRILTFVRSTDEEMQVQRLRSEGLQIQSVRLDRWSAILGILRAFLSGRPLQAGYFSSNRMRRALADDMDGRDILYVQLVRMAQYWKQEAPYAQVLDLCDALSVQYAERARLRVWWDFIWRAIDTVESRRLAAWERWIVRSFDAVSIVSAADASVVGGSPAVVPLHVQDYLDYQAPPAICRRNAEILFAGELSTYYSELAVRFLLGQVMPHVWSAMPSARVVIVGANPTPAILSLREPRVEVTGFVNDLREYFVRASVLACPVWIGTGLKTKILQAMAIGTPVVASTLANRGIGAFPGQHLIVADEASEFAEAILRLTTDETSRIAITTLARQFVQTRYSERAIGSGLDDLIWRGYSNGCMRAMRLTENRVDPPADCDV